MPFREKLKKAFKSNNSSQPSSKNPSPTLDQKKEPTRWPSNVYRPDEPMPRPKYRAPVKKEHKDKLEAFDFGNSWRRKSHVSLYSPMGSRMPSRRGSRVGNRESMELRRKSIAQQSGKTGTTSRSNSITSSTYDPAKARTVQRAAQPSTLNPEPEQYGDDDVANVGLSRVNSKEKPPSVGFSPSHSFRRAQAPPTLRTRSSGLSAGRNGDRPNGHVLPVTDQPDQPLKQEEHVLGPGQPDITPGPDLPDHTDVLRHTDDHDDDDRVRGTEGRADGGQHGEVAAVQETPQSKKDSGPPSEHVMGLVSGKLFSEEDLVRAMERNRMSATRSNE